MRIAGLVVAIALLAGSAVLLAEEESPKPVRKKVPGTGVSFLVPPGFVKASRFAGFGREEGAASLMAVELGGPIGEVLPGMTKAAWKKQGVTILDRKDVTVDGRKGALFHGSQEMQGVRFRKWIAIFGDAKGTVLAMGTFLAEAKEELSDVLRTAVLSAKVGPREPADPFEGLDYRVTPPKTLRLSKRIGQLLAYTEDGEEARDAPKPLFVVGPSQGGGKITDVKAFSERRVEQIADVTGATVTSGKAVTIAGLPGYEIVAAARHAKQDVALAVYQVVLARKNRGYYIMQGLVGADRKEVFLAAFRKIAGSFALK